MSPKLRAIQGVGRETRVRDAVAEFCDFPPMLEKGRSGPGIGRRMRTNGKWSAIGVRILVLDYRQKYSSIARRAAMKPIMVAIPVIIQ